MSDLNNKNTGNKNKNLLLVTQLFTTLFIYCLFAEPATFL